MKKTAYFEENWDDGWPSVEWLRPIFATVLGKHGFKEGDNDNWGFNIEGLYGTSELPRRQSVNVHLYVTGHPDHGVTLQYTKWDGRIQKQETVNSKGDLRRLGEFVRSRHGDLLCIGLFIPFESAWKAVKEFIERNGELPTSVEWIASRDLPPGTFPDP
jgi:Immunity protein Imm1